MKTYFLILVLLFALANSDGSYTITKAENGKCDTEGNGILDLIITWENPITELLKFSLKLIELDEITANCETQDDSSDSLIPDKASDSIAESEFLSVLWKKKVHLQHQQVEQVQIQNLIKIKTQIHVQNQMEVREQMGGHGTDGG